MPHKTWTDAFQRQSLYRNLCLAFRRKPPLFLSEKEFQGAKHEFIARDVGRHLERLRRSQTPPLPPKPISEILPLDAMNELQALLWPIHTWQGRAAFATNARAYAEATAKLKHFRSELKRIANSLVPPKPRFSKLKEDPLSFLCFYADRLFFWTVLHNDYKAFGTGRRNEALVLSGLKKAYSFVTFPEDLDTRLKTPVGASALEDVAKEFGLSAESIPPLLSRWLSRSGARSHKKRLQPR